MRFGAIVILSPVTVATTRDHPSGIVHDAKKLVEDQ
jgi:hypothetical protein